MKLRGVTDQGFKRLAKAVKGQEDDILEDVPEIQFDTTSTGREDWDERVLGKPDRFEVTVLEMTPDEWLELVEHWRWSKDDDKIAAIADSIKDGGTLPTPTLLYSYGPPEDEYPVSFIDGLHRTLAMKSLGVEKMKVLSIVDKDPW